MFLSTPHARDLLSRIDEHVCRMETIKRNLLQSIPETMKKWANDSIRSMVISRIAENQYMDIAQIARLKSETIDRIRVIGSSMAAKLAAIDWPHQREFAELADSDSSLLPNVKNACADCRGELKEMVCSYGFDLGEKSAPTLSPEEDSWISSYNSQALDAQRLVSSFISAEEEFRISRLKQEAAALWENALTSAYGEGIDWGRAWKFADRFENVAPKWKSRFTDWLLIKQNDEASFFDFAKETGECEKVIESMRPIWRSRLVRAVSKLTGKQLDQTLLDLVEEQIQKRKFDPDFFQRFGEAIPPGCFKCDLCGGVFTVLCDRWTDHICLDCCDADECDADGHLEFQF